APSIETAQILSPVEIRVDQHSISVSVSADRIVEIRDVRRVVRDVFNDVPREHDRQKGYRGPRSSVLSLRFQRDRGCGVNKWIDRQDGAQTDSEMAASY